MQDFISKGTGNSRYLKSVSNFKELYPTYDDFVEALIGGTLPVDLNGINDAGVQQRGTPLNKASLLTDEVSALLGLTSSATVSQALEALANGAASRGSGTYYAECDSDTNAEIKEISIPDLKTVTRGTRLSVKFNKGNAVDQPSLFLTYNNGNRFLQKKISAQIYGYSNYGDYMLFPGSILELLFTQLSSEEGAKDEWVFAPTPNISSVYSYRDTYIGKGLYGSDSQIALSGKGQIVLGMVMPQTKNNVDFCLICNGLAISYVNNEWHRLTVTDEGFYSSENAAVQMNEEGRSYAYAIIRARH